MCSWIAIIISSLLTLCKVSIKELGADAKCKSETIRTVILVEKEKTTRFLHKVNHKKLSKKKKKKIITTMHLVKRRARDYSDTNKRKVCRNINYEDL